MNQCHWLTLVLVRQCEFVEWTPGSSRHSRFIALMKTRTRSSTPRVGRVDMKGLLKRQTVTFEELSYTNMFTLNALRRPLCPQSSRFGQPILNRPDNSPWRISQVGIRTLDNPPNR